MSLKAFIGASLGSSAFSKQWISQALEHLIRMKHDDILVVIADDIWLYTRLFGADGRFAGMEQALQRMTLLSQETRQSFAASSSRLQGDNCVVSIKSWADFSDFRYAHLLRILRSAVAHIPNFAKAVESSALQHLSRMKAESATQKHALLMSCIDYVLDEMAMCLRITELAGYSDEYYPGEQVGALSLLYTGAFADSGLSVETLTGRASKRRFTSLIF